MLNQSPPPSAPETAKPPSAAGPDSPPSCPGTSSEAKTAIPPKSKPEEVKARVRETLNRIGDFTGPTRTGRPPNIDGRVAELERLTGKRVILRGPDDKPEAIDVGNMVVTPAQYEELQLESEESLAQGFQALSDLWAEWLGKESIKVKPGQAKTLGKVWNLALTKMIARAWLKFSTVMVAGFITLFWFAPRMLETVKYLMKKRRPEPKKAP